MTHHIDLEEHIQSRGDSLCFLGNKFQKSYSEFLIDIKNINKDTLENFQILKIDKKDQYYGICKIFAYWINQKSPLIIDKEVHQNEIEYFKLNLPKMDLQKDLQTGVILATSGSSGNSKLCQLSLENLCLSARSTNQYYQLGYKDSWALTLPLHHIAGLQIILRMLLAGGRITLSESWDKFDPKLANCISLVPTQLHRIINQNIKSIKEMKLILLGGATCSAELQQSIINENLTISYSYGSTETLSQITAGPLSDLSDRSAGSPLPGKKIKIINNLIGVMAPIYSGYWEKGNLVKPDLIDGYYLTNDYGEFENNKLKIVERKDSIIISGGENISTEQIKKHLLNIKTISEAYCIGIPDQQYGQKLIAFIKHESFLDENLIKAKLKKDLPPFKIPKNIYSINKHESKGPKISKKELIAFLEKEDNN
jgi:O-succinylbenzoic acid--CoA ligase